MPVQPCACMAKQYYHVRYHVSGRQARLPSLQSMLEDQLGHGRHARRTALRWRRARPSQQQSSCEPRSGCILTDQSLGFRPAMLMCRLRVPLCAKERVCPPTACLRSAAAPRQAAPPLNAVANLPLFIAMPQKMRCCPKACTKKCLKPPTAPLWYSGDSNEHHMHALTILQDEERCSVSVGGLLNAASVDPTS